MGLPLSAPASPLDVWPSAKGLPPPGYSAQLEEELGTALLTRNAPGVVLTKAGEALHLRAGSVFYRSGRGGHGLVPGSALLARRIAVLASVDQRNAAFPRRRAIARTTTTSSAR